MLIRGGGCHDAQLGGHLVQSKLGEPHGQDRADWRCSSLARGNMRTEGVLHRTLLIAALSGFAAAGAVACGGHHTVSVDAPVDSGGANEPPSCELDLCDSGATLEEGGGIDYTTACLGKENIFVFGSDNIFLLGQTPYVLGDPDVDVQVLGRVSGLPAAIDIIDATNPVDFIVEFSTQALNTPLGPGTYDVAASTGGGGVTMSIASRGSGGESGSFQVIEMQALPVSDPSSLGPAGLTSFTATFDIPTVHVGGCIHVVIDQ